MFERLTDRARRVLVLAQEESGLLQHSFIGTEHLLLGLIGEGEGIATIAMSRCGITLEVARSQVREIVGASLHRDGDAPPFTPRAKKVLELSLREALQLGHSSIGTEHLLLGLVREGQGVGATVIERLGVNLETVRQEVITLMAGNARPLEEESGESRVASPHADPPRCHRCRAGLSEEARYKVIEVPADDVDGGESSLSVTVIYCNRCGTTFGTA